MLRNLTTVVAAFALLAPIAMAQTIYQGKDSKGNPVFTDQPRSGDKPVELPPINTTPPPRAVPPAPQQPRQFAGYSQIALRAPGSVPNDSVPVEVGIATDPELLDGHLWRLSVDGELVATGRDAGHTLPSLARGQHTLTLEISDADGQIVGEAAPANVFVQFVKGNNAPQRPNRVRPAPN